MKMEFIFDEEKMKKEKITKEECLKKVREHFDNFRSESLKETKEGIYIGTEESDWDAFACTFNFPYTYWFLKVIKEWYWYYDEQDGKGIQKGDCLKAYYEVKAVNGG